MSHTVYLQLEESIANTHFDVLLNLVWSHHWLKTPYLTIFHVNQGKKLSCSKFYNKRLQDPSKGPPANYVYGCHMTPVTRGALEYVSYQKGIIQGHLVNRYASRRAPALCSRIVFRTVLSLDVSTQTIYLYHMSEKYSLRGYLRDFRCTCYALLVRSNKWNQYKFSILYRLSI